MYTLPTITINGVKSTTLAGLLVTELPPISKPLQRTLIDVIDGRDGDIITPLGYSAYDKTAKIALTKGYQIDDIIKFFDSEGLVVFSNEPDKVYNFTIYEQIDFERLLRFRTAEVVFHVQPFKKLLDEPLSNIAVPATPATIYIYNAGNIYSRPTISITGLGLVTLSVNNIQVLSMDLGETSREIIIDCEKMNAYSTDNTLLNRLVTGNYDNIKFNVGRNSITVTGLVSRVKISNYTRWI